MYVYIGAHLLFQSQAACADLVRLSEAAREDSSTCEAVARAAAIPVHDAEKGTHKLLNIFGLSLKVKVSFLELNLRGEFLRIPYLKPSDYLRRLLLSYPSVVWGAGVTDPKQRCRTFWKAYYASHPTHVAFTEFDANNLQSLLPIQLHGDEGTGSKKQPVSILNWQTVWGVEGKCNRELSSKTFGACPMCPSASRLGSCCEMPSTWAQPSDESMQLDELDRLELQGQVPTTAGHSFLQRHLVAVLPTHLCTKGPEVLDEVLKAMSLDLKKLFRRGLRVGPTHYWASLVGCKGDAKWHASTARLLRSFHNLSDVNPRPICAECFAGHVDYPFEDTGPSPAWVHTLYETEPWDPMDRGWFERIPYDPAMPARKYKRDLLHVFRIGLARDICGSCITMLCRHFKKFDDVGDSVELSKRLKRAHGRFALWAMANHKSPHLRGFTKDSLHLSRVDGFAYTNCKGSDSMLLLAWLRTEFGLMEQWNLPEHQDGMCLVRAARAVCNESLNLFELLYCHGLFLPRACFQAVRDHILTITRGYSYLSAQCLRRGIPGFGLKTTLHAMHHYAIDMDLGLQANSTCLPNPLMWECGQCEDFIGRVARVARSTHAKTTALRCLQRHLVKKKLLLKRFCKRGS